MLDTLEEGIKDAIHRVYPKADHQSCWVHLTRNVSNAVRVKDREEVMGDLKRVYTADGVEPAKAKLSEFTDKWEVRYPKVMEKLDSNPSLLTFMSYPKEIWKSIYTTNSMENFHKHLKRYTKRKEQFPDEESLIRFAVSLANQFNYRHANRIMKGFKQAKERLEEMLESRGA